MEVDSHLVDNVTDVNVEMNLKHHYMKNDSYVLEVVEKLKNILCKKCENHLYLTKDYECAIKEPGCIYKNGICSECYSPFESTGDYKCIIEGCE